MKVSIRKGLGFGLTSGVITTLGLIIGLNSGIGSKEVILAGILIIAIADALSDAFGVHISEESGRKKSHQDVWNSTFATFFSKLFFALTFLIPILLFELKVAVMVSIFWGLFLIVIFNIYLAKIMKEKVSELLFKHVMIAILVIVVTHLTGLWINNFFA